MRVAVSPILLACCAVEVATALHTPAEVEGITWVAENAPRDATVVVVAGTVTRAMEPRVHEIIAAAPEPKAVIAYGVCASSGGPYWDSHAVVQGIDADLLVPGCPPPPPVLWSSVAAAVRQVVADAAH